MGLTRKRDFRDGEAVWTAYRVPKVRGAPAALGRDRRDTPLTKLARAIDRRKAEQVEGLARRGQRAADSHRSSRNRRSYGHQTLSLYLAGDVLDARRLKREVSARQRIGLASEYLDRRALHHHFGIDRPAAPLSHGNVEANPVELAAGYLRQALRAGARFHAPHDVLDIHCGRRRSTLILDEGLEIETRQVVLCTGYELAKIKEPICICGATGDGRVICGGEDEEFADSAKRDPPDNGQNKANREETTEFVSRAGLVCGDGLGRQFRRQS